MSDLERELFGPYSDDEYCLRNCDDDSHDKYCPKNGIGRSYRAEAIADAAAERTEAK